MVGSCTGGAYADVACEGSWIGWDGPGGAACMDPLCAAGPEGSFCADADTVAACSAGVYGETRCDPGQRCEDLGAGASCADVGDDDDDDDDDSADDDDDDDSAAADGSPSAGVDGCGCRVTGGPGAGSMGLGVLIAATTRRRRQRREARRVGLTGPGSDSGRRSPRGRRG